MINIYNIIINKNIINNKIINILQKFYFFNILYCLTCLSLKHMSILNNLNLIF